MSDRAKRSQLDRYKDLVFASTDERPQVLENFTVLTPGLSMKEVICGMH